MAFVSQFLLNNRLSEFYTRNLIQFCPRIGDSNCLWRIQQELGTIGDEPKKDCEEKIHNLVSAYESFELI